MRRNRFLLAGVAILLPLGLAARAFPQQAAEKGVASPPSATPALPPGTPKGYLPLTALPDSLALLPPPPDPGSPGFVSDEAASRMAEALRGTARWNRASSDAVLRFPGATQFFQCAAGIRIDPETTPVLFRLIGKTLIDVGLSTYKAKNHYNRVRPFVQHGATTCYPPDEAMLRKDGSYPSGHSAAGWGWALVLTELVPDRTDAILQRGRDFGQSRVICQAHWQSDVDAGRVIAAGTVARLHADPAFLADLQAAKAEIATAAKPDAAECAAEAASLAATR